MNKIDKESKFVEIVLSVEDQQERSKEWYGDANHSDHEVLEKQTITRNGREFSIKDFSDLKGYKYATRQQGYDMLGDIALFTEEQEIPSPSAHFDEDGCFDTAFYIGCDENLYYFEGDLNDFIYVIQRCKLPIDFKPFSIFDALSVFDNPLYSPDREMTDYEMDVLL